MALLRGLILRSLSALMLAQATLGFHEATAGFVDSARSQFSPRVAVGRPVMLRLCGWEFSLSLRTRARRTMMLGAS